MNTLADGMDTVHVPSLPTDPGNLTAALAYATAGLYVLPVKRGTKNPGSIVGERWQDKSSRDPQVITSWLAGTDHGIAIDLGRSGLVVIDVDHPELLPSWLADELAEGVPYQSTRPDTLHRGHYVYAQPPGRRIGCAKGDLEGMGLDVKGDGGVIIVQPTEHPDGGEYYWVSAGSIPALPDAIADRLHDRTDTASAATDAEVNAFLAEHKGTERRMLVKGWEKRFRDGVTDGDSRHDTMVPVLTGAMEEALAGYFPATEAVNALRNLFVSAKTQTYHGKPPLSQAKANDSFKGILAWAIAQAKKHSREEIRARTEENMPQDSLTMTPSQFLGLESVPSSEQAAAQVPNPWNIVPGDTFIFDQPKDVPAVWGKGKQVLWSEGEGLMIAGPQGVGKTGIAVQIARGLMGLETNIFGLPVSGCGEPILYLAMDRPRQIARLMARQFSAGERDIVRGKLIVRPGPPPADLAKDPTLLVRMASELNAKYVFIDSLKDGALGLSDDEIGAKYNRARQHVLADGREICDLHHVVKRNPQGGPPTGIADIYGSTWLTSGCGSVVLLIGNPGDPIVKLRHVKLPVDEVGPLTLVQDETTGMFSITEAVDLVKLADQGDPANGITAKEAARVLFETDKPTGAQLEKARRRLDATEGLWCQEGARGRGAAARWFPSGVH